MKLCIVLGLVISGLLSGCGGFITKWGHKFEGLGDYRVRSSAVGTNTPKGEWEGRYVRGVASTFDENDYISVSLKSGYIHSFTEGWLKRKSNDVAGAFGQDSPVRGQIAVVVNITEKKNGTDTGTANSSGRVVYYSDDVYERQPLNDSFAPVYGPVRWGGNPITVELTIMELDQEDNAQLRQILQTAADIGTDLNSLGSAKLISGLNRIGDALLTSNADDVMGKYKATFVPSVATNDYGLPVLRHGDLIFARKGDREELINWEVHCYNEAEGLVQKREENKNKAGEYVDSITCNNKTNSHPDFSYFVMTIGKNLGNIDMTPELSLQQLQDQIKNSGSIQSVQTSVDKFSATIVRELTFRRAGKSLKDLSDPSAPMAVRKLEARIVAEALQCSYLASSPKTPAQISIIQGVCGAGYIDASLSQSELSYYTRKLVRMRKCLSPDNLNDQAMQGDMTGAGLRAARDTLSNQISICESI